MKYFKSWILIGGTGRNIGKTTLAEMLINKLSRLGPVVGIKISNVKPEGLEFHGTHKIKSNGSFFIWEETNTSGDKDSMRFLKAGAKRSFFIQTGDEFLQEAFQKMVHQLDENEMVVCESNSLRDIMEPGAFLMLNGENNPASKRYVEKFLKDADYVVKPMDLEQFEKLSKSVILENGQIKLTVNKD